MTDRTVFPDYIVCLEDGRKFKSLKRALRVQYGMTPEQYRAKWNLPDDYPMIAPSYAKPFMGMGRRANKSANR